MFLCTVSVSGGSEGVTVRVAQVLFGTLEFLPSLAILAIMRRRSESGNAISGHWTLASRGGFRGDPGGGDWDHGSHDDDDDFDYDDVEGGVDDNHFIHTEVRAGGEAVRAYVHHDTRSGESRSSWVRSGRGNYAGTPYPVPLGPFAAGGGTPPVDIPKRASGSSRHTKKSSKSGKAGRASKSSRRAKRRPGGEDDGGDSGGGGAGGGRGNDSLASYGTDSDLASGGEMASSLKMRQLPNVVRGGGGGGYR